jgi:hypothetical protein
MYDTRLCYFLASQRAVQLFYDEQLLDVFRFCVHKIPSSWSVIDLVESI